MTDAIQTPASQPLCWKCRLHADFASISAEWVAMGVMYKASPAWDALLRSMLPNIEQNIGRSCPDIHGSPDTRAG